MRFHANLFKLEKWSHLLGLPAFFDHGTASISAAVQLSASFGGPLLVRKILLIAPSPLKVGRQARWPHSGAARTLLCRLLSDGVPSAARGRHQVRRIAFAFDLDEIHQRLVGLHRLGREARQDAPEVVVRRRESGRALRAGSARISAAMACKVASVSPASNTAITETIRAGRSCRCSIRERANSAPDCTVPLIIRIRCMATECRLSPPLRTALRPCE